MNTDFLNHESRPDILRELPRRAIVEIGELQKKLFGRGTETLEKELKSKNSQGLLLHGGPENPDLDLAEKKTVKDRSVSGESVLYSSGRDELQDEAVGRGFTDAKATDWDFLYNQNPAGRPLVQQ